MFVLLCTIIEFFCLEVISKLFAPVNYNNFWNKPKYFLPLGLILDTMQSLLCIHIINSFLNALGVTCFMRLYCMK